MRDFVANAHGDPDAVGTALEAEPAPVNAAWDWGGGDCETALGAAAHPAMRDAVGPHGIPLRAHAQGAVVELLA